jgi:deoxyribodipyrimidine photo-lyase
VSPSIIWLRRDLRLRDNVALFNAARGTGRLCVAFVLDPSLLRGGRFGAPIVQAFFGALEALRARLRSLGSDLALLEGDASTELPALATRLGATALYFNEDYEPSAIARDAAVTAALQRAGVRVEASPDHVYFGADEVVQNNGAPYQVFTAYRNRWRDLRQFASRAPVESERSLAAKLLTRDAIGPTRDVPAPEEFGHASSPLYPRVDESTAQRLLEEFLAPGGPVERYKNDRNLPAIDATSHLSPQLRAGTIGIRECVERAFARADAGNDLRANVDAWIDELVWRDFYAMILRRFPHVVTQPFREAGKRIPWREPGEAFAAWCDGRTGYPIVDAAMRQLNATGWMHNRLRMIVASFLSKDLLVDWRHGERYFEQHLADADLAANNGGWQWVASTGVDAAPYFRIFSPVRQGKTFDPDGAFVRSMLSELRNVPDAFIHEPWKMPPSVQAQAECAIGREYPAPIVDHASTRARALAAFAR